MQSTATASLIHAPPLCRSVKNCITPFALGVHFSKAVVVSTFRKSHLANKAISSARVLHIILRPYKS